MSDGYKPPGDDEQNSSSPTEWLGKIGLPLGVGVILSILAALGIKDDLLARLLRNHASELSLALTMAMVGIGLPIAGLLIVGATRKWAGESEPRMRVSDAIGAIFGFLGVVVLIWGAIVGTSNGVSSFGDKEQPSIRIVSTGDGAMEKVTVTASAHALRTTEHMYLRIIAFDEKHADQVSQSCGDTLVEVSTGARVLYWGQSGSADATGTVTSEVNVEVEKDNFPFLCAHAILTDPNQLTTSTPSPASSASGAAPCPTPAASGTPGKDGAPPQTAECSQVAPTPIPSRAGDRFSSLFVDLRNAPVTPTSSASAGG
ncbi:hypothetical protein QF031_002959 [Pseudarthrobacter defluvii]|uniref:hypothetical protein n=1 Tax=Pseudarthrobacter defluvii TaxID=410837 RepID=UPI0027845C1A|nr:hypothetical protein [Pseudarthrobacter defluvii]MDQ0770210.1 hypothetical protein [Pseudarthrobacter defluvii]